MTFEEIKHLYLARLAEAEQSKLLFRIRNNCDKVYGRHILILSVAAFFVFVLCTVAEVTQVKYLCIILPEDIYMGIEIVVLAICSGLTMLLGILACIKQYYHVYISLMLCIIFFIMTFLHVCILEV